MLVTLFSSRTWLLLLALINSGGFLFGILYYWPQLQTIHPVLWLFVMDSPVAVLLFAGFCFSRLLKHLYPSWLTLITSIALIKVGFWTVFVLHIHWNFFFSANPLLYTAIYILHWGMVVEGLTLFPFFNIPAHYFFPAFFWFLFNDWLDYGLGFYPWIPTTHLGLIATESLIATLFLLAITFIYSRQKLTVS